jgi:RND family efflux transporter MFP subunit
MIQKKLKTLLMLLAIVGLVGLGWIARSVVSDSAIFGQPAIADQGLSASGDPLSNGRALPVRVLRLGGLTTPDRADRYRGTIEPSKSADLSFRRGGRLAAIHVREGDKVKLGQLLANLETNDVQATIRGIESRVKEAEAVLAEQEAGPRQESIKAAKAILKERESALNLAKLTLDRELRLLKSEASSRQSYDEAQTAWDRTSADVEAAREQLNELLAGTRAEQINAQKARIDALKAQLDDLRVQLDDCQLIAPFSGVVSIRYVDEGIIASPERPVLKLLQVDPLEARFGVSPKDAAQFRVGQQVMLSATGVKTRATISRIEPELDQATRTQGLIVSIDQNLENSASSTAGLIPGQTVSLAFDESASDDSIWVPVQSLSRSVRGLWSVYKLSASKDDQWTVERHIVQVVEVDDQLCQIKGGTIQTGDLVVSEGLHRLTPGMVVEPMESDKREEEKQSVDHQNPSDISNSESPNSADSSN